MPTLLGRIIAQGATAKRQHPTARIADRKHDAIAEPVIAGAAVFGLDQEARLNQHLISEAFIQKIIF